MGLSAVLGGMSARDELLREMTHNHLYMTDERAAELIDALLAEHDHELAGRLRAEGQRILDASLEKDHDLVDGLDHGADLIDPKNGE